MARIDVSTTLNAPTADPEVSPSHSADAATKRGGRWRLTLLYHPELLRIGESVEWARGVDDHLELGRAAPAFAGDEGAVPRPLSEIHISRKAITLKGLPEGIEIQKNGSPTRVLIEGRPAAERELLSEARLDEGVLLSLGGHVLLMLQSVAPASSDPTLGLLGKSPGIVELRRRVRQLASFDIPVLIRGESGVGKELVAQALHALSPRAAAPLVAVNMAVLTPSTAGAALFGHDKGAYTGAGHRRLGYFGEAESGTLFLDEIGDTPTDVQPMLLRAIDAREVQPVGLPPRRVDVRIVAATDAPLERLIAEGRFRRPLFHRLSAATLYVPPLRERRCDIPLLLVHFLGQALEELGQVSALGKPKRGSRSPVDLKTVSALVAYPWPGNVRELMGVVRAMALDIIEGSPSALPPAIGRALAGGGATRAAPPSPAVQSLESLPPARVSEASFCEALEAAGWSVAEAARSLGISRNSVYVLMERFGLRRAAQLSRAEIEEAMAEYGGDRARLSAALKVSPRGLTLRLKTLGMCH